MTFGGDVASVQYQSGDANLVGVLYAAPGSGARPAAILLHGIPGSERNVDLAYRLREMGWHILLPAFRGAWGSGGNYDPTTHPDDVIASIDYLLNTQAPWTVDPVRLALIGYSLGSRAALVAARRDPRVGAVVSLSGIADFDEIMLDEEAFTSASTVLRGASATSLRTQWTKLGGADNPITVISRLTQPVFIVQGTEDTVVPSYMAPALHAASTDRARLEMIDGADHVFTFHRAQLVDLITNWLDEWVKMPQSE